MKNALILDNEKFNEENLLRRVKSILNDSHATLTHVKDVGSFEEKLQKNIKWSMVIVNFQMLELLDLRPIQMREFIKNIRACQKEKFIFIGVTPYKTHTSLMEEFEVWIRHKDYNGLASEEELELFKQPKNPILMKRICKITCDYFAVSFKKMTAGKLSRKEKELLKVKKVIIYLTKVFTNYSGREIADFYGYTGISRHCAVNYAYNETRQMIKKDAEIKNAVKALSMQIEMLRKPLRK
jgi:hypothetical protein